MLTWIINLLLLEENPNKERFEDLIDNISSAELFPKKVKKSKVYKKDLNRFTIERKAKSPTNIIYEVYGYEKHNTDLDFSHLDPRRKKINFELCNHKIGYQIHIKDGELDKIYKISNPVFFNKNFDLYLKRRKRLKLVPASS